MYVKTRKNIRINTYSRLRQIHQLTQKQTLNTLLAIPCRRFCFPQVLSLRLSTQLQFNQHSAKPYFKYENHKQRPGRKQPLPIDICALRQ